MSDAIQPGRLGNPDATLFNDRRADRRIAGVVEATGGIAGDLAAPASDASYEECLEFCAAFEAAAGAMNDELTAALPVFADVERSTEVIQGVDGNDITLYIHRKKGADGPLPCVVHTHGGGMVLMTAQDPGFVRLRDELADRGMVVVGVEFRNGGGKLGNHPFPAGLNDCATATQWVIERKAELGISSIVISGESGGGNLSIATTLKAKQEGWSNQIDGVYAMCPYISGQYANPPAMLGSLEENEGYMLDQATMAAMVKVYDPTGEHATNPLAWPLHASDEDLQGLPPHVVSMNELDPLRDEGAEFYRKLLAVGVPAVGKVSLGTPHAGDGSFPDITPEVFKELVGSIYNFAHSLS